MDFYTSLYALYFFVKVRWAVKGRFRFQSVLTFWVLKAARQVKTALLYPNYDLLIKQSSPLSMLPQSMLNLVFGGVYICPEAVLLAAVPPAFEHALVRPLVYTEPLLFVIEKLSNVLCTVTINVYAVAMHIVVLKLTKVLSSIEP